MQRSLVGSEMCIRDRQCIDEGYEHFIIITGNPNLLLSLIHI
ncbi:hypothetical protein JMUB7514_27900 [Staphylococcus aureus]